MEFDAQNAAFDVFERLYNEFDDQVADAKKSQKSHKYVVSNIYSIDLPRQIGP